MIRGNVRKVSVIIFGVFRIEEVFIPAVIDDAGPYLVANLLISTAMRGTQEHLVGHEMEIPTAISVDIPGVIRVLWS